MRSVVDRVKKHGQEKVSFDYSQVKDIFVEGLSDYDRAKIFVENLFIGEYKFDKYLSKKEGRISEIIIFGDFSLEDKKAFTEAEIISLGVNKARDWSNEPGGFMTPTVLAKQTKDIFKGIKNIKVKVLEDSETRKLKMGLYNSVGEASIEKSKFIIVEYFGGKKSEKPTVLIGKGVTFDTGGVNLKQDGGKDMHMDMTGGATVLSALFVAAKLDIKKNIVVLVPAAENAISGSATRVGDIITSLSGKTVQIMNTDAEGRLVLADAITYAKRYNPKTVIDVATLTGASLMAVGQRASVVMSNDSSLEKNIREKGEKVGDYFWPLPLWDEYGEHMKSKFADLSNLSDVKWGGAITAGIFLGEFVKDLGKNVSWAHLDIAPREQSIPSDILESGATGEPVKMLVELLKDN